MDIDYVKKLRTLDEISPGVYRANHMGVPTGSTGNVYGGLLFAQAMAAAEKSTDKKFASHAIHAFFILNVTPDKPVDYRVQKLRDGRSFCTRSIIAEQEGKVVFSVQVSLCVKEPTAIEHQPIGMPNVPPPEQLRPYYEEARVLVAQHEKGETKLSDRALKYLNNHINRYYGRKNGNDESSNLFEMRPVEPAKYMGILPARADDPMPHKFLVWMKTIFPITGEDDNAEVHRFLAAYISDAAPATSANRPHISRGYKPSMLLSLDHTLHFHDDNYRLDEWLLYENVSRIAKNGRALSEGRIWTHDGRLVISVSQESLNRTKGEKSSL